MMRRCMNCMEELKAGATVCTHCGWDNSDMLPQDRNLPAGTVLQSRYLLGRVLGSGGFGITYIAYDKNLQRKVAIKEFFPSDFASRQIGATHLSVFSGDAGVFFRKAKESFISEGHSLAAFANNRAIVSIHDSFEANETAYIVMEYLEGKTLKQLLKVRGKLSYPDALTVMVPVLDALDIVHRSGIIHRDVSPDNIFVRTDESVALIDFGSARSFGFGIGRSMTVVLKPGYAPPEQYHSRGAQGPWTDVYAVAAVFYRIITGTPPEESVQRAFGDTLKRPSELGVDIPDTSEAALMAALSVQSVDRIQSVQELLSGLLEDIGITSKQAPEQTFNPPVANEMNAVRFDEPQPTGWVSLAADGAGAPSGSKKKTFVVVKLIFLLLIVAAILGVPISILTSGDDDQSYTVVDLQSVKAGDIVHLGEFAFETHGLINGYSNLSEMENRGDFAWRVLEVRDGKVLVISEDVVAREYYHGTNTDITWGKSYIRAWLNNYFLEGMPSDVRERVIEVDVVNDDNPEYGTPGGNDTRDKVFLLSAGEVERYFAGNYARMSILDMKGDYSNGSDFWWWLRSPGDDAGRAAFVSHGGSVNANGVFVDYGNVGVRPAFWLNL